MACGGRTDEKASASLCGSERKQGPESDQGSTGKVCYMRKTQKSAAQTQGLRIDDERTDLGMTCYGCADECFQGVPRRAPRTRIWEIWFLSAFREWSFLFGAHPKRLATDRGSEFINRTVADSGVSKRGCPLGTSACTPASNGLIDRHDGFGPTRVAKLEWLARRSGIEGHRF